MNWKIIPIFAVLFLLLIPFAQARRAVKYMPAFPTGADDFIMYAMTFMPSLDLTVKNLNVTGVLYAEETHITNTTVENVNVTGEINATSLHIDHYSDTYVTDKAVTISNLWDATSGFSSGYVYNKALELSSESSTAITGNLDGSGGQGIAPRNFGLDFDMRVSGEHSANISNIFSETNRGINFQLVRSGTLSQNATNLNRILNYGMLTQTWDMIDYNNPAGKIVINSYGSYNLLNAQYGNVISGDVTRNLYGFYVDAVANNEGNTNLYGFYVGNITGADNNWAIYTEEGLVYFGDDVYFSNDINVSGNIFNPNSPVKMLEELRINDSENLINLTYNNTQLHNLSVEFSFALGTSTLDGLAPGDLAASGTGTFNEIGLTSTDFSIIENDVYIELIGDGVIEGGFGISIPQTPGSDFFYGYGGGESHRFGRHGEELIIDQDGNLISTGSLALGTSTLDGLDPGDLNMSGVLYTTKVGIGISPEYRLHVPWLTGDSTSTVFFGSNAGGNDQTALYSRSNSGSGVLGRSVSGYGIYGLSSTGLGGFFSSTSGNALATSSVSGYGAFLRSTDSIAFRAQSTNSLSGYFDILPASNDTVDDVIAFRRQTSDIAEDGMGGRLLFIVENDAEEINEVIGAIDFIATDVSDGSEDGFISILTRADGGALKHQVNISNIGNVDITGNTTAENIWLPTYCFAHTDDTQNITGAGVWLNVSFDKQASLCTHMTHTHSDSTNDTFTIQDDGVYDISYHLTFSDTAPSPSGHVEMRITRNATETLGSALEEDSSKQYNDFTLSNGIIVALTKDDWLKFQFVADDDTIGMSAHAEFSDHRDTGVIKIKRIG